MAQVVNNTTVILDFHPMRDPEQIWRRIASSQVVEQVDAAHQAKGTNVAGVTFGWSRDNSCYYIARSEVMLELPAWLEEMLLASEAWTVRFVKISTNEITLDPKRRPYLGYYRKLRKYPGCQANVTMTIEPIGEGPAEVTLVEFTGTRELFARCYCAILSRRVRPSRWLEIRPCWLKRLFGLR